MGSSTSCNFLRLPGGCHPLDAPLLPGGATAPARAGSAFWGVRGAVAPLGSSSGSGGRQTPGEAQETAGSAATYLLLPI
eukprot:5929769-Alexandrium_andersonii.AAC.1